jgi:hypothetical protein
VLSGTGRDGRRMVVRGSDGEDGKGNESGEIDDGWYLQLFPDLAVGDGFGEWEGEWWDGAVV